MHWGKSGIQGELRELQGMRMGQEELEMPLEYSGLKRCIPAIPNIPLEAELRQAPEKFNRSGSELGENNRGKVQCSGKIIKENSSA